MLTLFPQQPVDVLTKKFCGLALIRIQRQPNPQQMEMVRHQAKRRTSKIITGQCMNVDFAPVRIKILP